MQKSNYPLSIIPVKLRYGASHYPFRRQSGQIALIVLLLMTVMLTIGLAVAQRGLFDTAITEQEEETSRAFQAAETGVEEALRTLIGTGGDKDLTTGVSYNVTVADQGTAGFVTSETVGVEDVLELVTVGTTAGSVDIFYSHSPTSSCADTGSWGVEVEKVYEPAVGDAWISRTVNMTDALGAVQFQGQWFCKTVGSVTTIASDPFFADLKKIRVRPMGKPTGSMAAGTLLGFQPAAGGALSAQYRLIRSEGKSAGGVTRAVAVTRSLPQLPTVFDYALLSGGDLIKVRPQFAPYVPDPADFEVAESIPVGNSTWPAGPVYVVATFNMDLHSSSTLTVTDASGTNYNSGATAVEGNSRVLRQKTTIGVPVAQKTYTVTWKPCVAAGNCRTTNNTFMFTVNPNFATYSDLTASNTVTIRLLSGAVDLPKVIMTRGKTLRFRNTVSGGSKRVITDEHLTGHTYMITAGGNVWRTSRLSNGDTDTVPVSDSGAYYYHVDDSSDNYLSGYDGVVVVK